MGRSLTSAFLSIFSARIATTAVTLVTLPIIVRVLGPDSYGDYAFLLSVFAIVMTFVSSGVTEGVQKYVGEDREAAWREHVVGFYLRLAVALAVVGALGTAAFALFGPVERLLDARFRTYFLLLGAFMFAAQLRSFVRRSLMGMELERYTEPLRVAYAISWVTIGLLLATAGWGVAGLLVGNIVACLAIAAVGGVLLARRLSIRETLSATPRSFPRDELLWFNALNIVLVLLMKSLYNVDVVMLRTLGGSEMTGHYKSALVIAEYLWFVPVSLQTVLLHSTSGLWAEDRRDRIEALTARITRYTLLLTCLLALGIAALAGRFVPLYYGPAFAEAVTPLRVLLPGVVAFAVVHPMYAVSQANGNLKPLVAATAGSALLNVALNAALIPAYGMVGAAVATGIGYGSMLAFHVRSARHLGFDPLADLRAGRVALTAGVAAVPVFGATLLLDDLLALAVVPPLGFAVYAWTAVATGAITADELADLAGALPVSVPASVRSFASSLVPHAGEGGRE
ncbi:polysaccharide biosynthesis C-terminal domain-containing protein [Halorussus salilacus]|uniref:oligosaccharide flippase family protein n=1 Tax=Halorussus salilacus TaxID=2953750 RepID=UPI00209E5E84|nr:polysaccharide biosynthesis C-terminal domain-containing protein [Halorussus salilacus]USZ67932.1 polysaccharide biosynthesis C-terminal domain-containing protein [Halorussus salilacus]